MKIPSPRKLGLPTNYKGWRPFQEDAIKAIDAGDNVTALMLPPGAGKSGIYMGWAAWRKQRVCILTSNRALQSQLATDFGGLGLTDLRGQDNYLCEITGASVADAPCHGGMVCELKKTTCTYFALMRRAKSERLVSTNYSFWLHNAERLGYFDVVVMDEFHASFDRLSSFVSISFSRKDGTLFDREPTSQWRPWASYQYTRVKSMLDDARRRADSLAKFEKVRVLRRVAEKLDLLQNSDPGAFIYGATHRGWTWECVWPGHYKDRLFRNAGRYVVTSGTMTKRTMSMMGFRAAEYSWHSFPCVFNPKRRPIYILPAPRMNAAAGPGDWQLWRNLIDKFISLRPEWKGLVHATSYTRVEDLLTKAETRDRMQGHVNSKGLPDAMAAFKRSTAGVLVSPSITEGTNFPYDAARFQILAKIPFPDPRNPVVVERTKQDKEYPWYVAAQTIIQTVFRIIRAEDDYGETAICDGSWDRFFQYNSHHFPAYFSESLIPVIVVPKSAKLLL